MDETLNTAKGTEGEYATEYDYWRTSIDLAQKGLKSWLTAAGKLSRLYCAKRALEDENLTDPKQPYHIFYSNIATLQPAVYARPPKVVVQRRFKDKDPVGRVAAQLLERATQSAIAQEDFDPAIRSVRDDWLIRSRGVARESFEPITDTLSDSQGSYEDVIGAQTRTDYVHWRDFIHPNCRSWQDVSKRWVAFKVLMTRDELVQRFGDRGADITLDAMPDDVDKAEHVSDKEAFKQATIYEIWDAKKKQVLWMPKVDDGNKQFLDVQSDPLRLQNFFPCPRPIFATLDNDSLYATADFIFYADLAKQLNLIQWKIDCLVRALKVVGIRDANCKELDRILNENCEFELIPVENFPLIVDKGGLQGAIIWMPMSEIVNTLQVLYDSQEKCLAQIYQTSGMSDIIRGYGDPRATATQEKIKMQFAAPRLDERKREMQRFLRDLVRIKAEIISEHFDERHLFLAADVDQLSEQDKQLFPQAVALLKNDRLRTFKIEIETDSTVMEDNEELKRERIEVMSHVGNFLRDMSPMIGAQPALLPLAKEMLLFSMRTFRESRAIEGSVEEVFDNLLQAPPPEQPPDPKMLEMQQKAQLDQARMQLEAQKFQFDAQMKQAEQELKRQEIQAKLQTEQLKYQAEVEKAKADYQLSMQKLAAEMDISEKDRAANMFLQQQQALAPAQESKGNGGSSPVVHVHTGSKKKMVSLTTDPLTGAKIGMVQDMEDDAD